MFAVAIRGWPRLSLIGIPLGRLASHVASPMWLDYDPICFVQKMHETDEIAMDQSSTMGDFASKHPYVANIDDIRGALVPMRRSVDPNLNKMIVGCFFLHA
jgi:hypothetical protein